MLLRASSHRPSQDFLPIRREPIHIRDDSVPFGRKHRATGRYTFWHCEAVDVGGMKALGTHRGTPPDTKNNRMPKKTTTLKLKAMKLKSYIYMNVL